MERWKAKDLEKMDDIDFAISILNERRNKLTNIYSPLSDKLAKAVRTLQEIKKSRLEKCG